MPLQKALHSKQLNIKAERSTAVQIEKKSLIRLGTVKISHVPSFLRQSWSTQPFLIHMFLCRELTKVPHMATSPGDEETVKYVLKRWQDPETGLDEAWRQEYEIYLSFPNPTNPNKVTVGEWNSDTVSIFCEHFSCLACDLGFICYFAMCFTIQMIVMCLFQ